MQSPEQGGLRDVQRVRMGYGSKESESVPLVIVQTVLRVHVFSGRYLGGGERQVGRFFGFVIQHS